MPSSFYDDIKTEIDLINYMLAHGCTLDEKASSQKNFMLRTSSEDKLSVTNKNGQWIYHNFKDNGDNGTIVDYCANHLGIKGVKALKEELGTWLEDPEKYAREWRENRGDFTAKPKEKSKPKESIKNTWGKIAIQSQKITYTFRGIRPEIMQAADVYWIPNQNRVFFPIRALTSEVVGVLRRSDEGREERIIPGSKKQDGLWISGEKMSEDIIISESPIDSLSMSDYYGRERDVLHLSMLGQPAPTQIALIASIARKRARQKRKTTFYLAVDNDSDSPVEDSAVKPIPGLKYIHEIVYALRDHTTDEVKISCNTTEKAGEKDWNDLLVAKGEGAARDRKIPFYPYWSRGDKGTPTLVLGETPMDILGYKHLVIPEKEAQFVATLGQALPGQIKGIVNLAKRLIKEGQKPNIHFAFPPDKLGEDRIEMVKISLTGALGEDAISFTETPHRTEKIHYGERKGTEDVLTWARAITNKIRDDKREARLNQSSPSPATSEVHT